MPPPDPETLRKIAGVALARADASRTDLTFDGMARGGAQRVLRQLAKDLEDAAVLAELEIKDNEAPVEFVKVADETWRSTDGGLELRRKGFRQGTYIYLYEGNREIKRFFSAYDGGEGLDGPERVEVFDIRPEDAQTKVGATTYGAILRAYVRAAIQVHDSRPNTVDYNPRRASDLAQSRSP